MGIAKIVRKSILFATVCESVALSHAEFIN